MDAFDKIYIGTIENNGFSEDSELPADPEGRNRCQVRVHGIHSEKKSESLSDESSFLAISLSFSIFQKSFLPTLDTFFRLDANCRLLLNCILTKLFWKFQLHPHT